MRTYLAQRRLLWRKKERLTDLPPETGTPSDVEHEERIIVRRALAAEAAAAIVPRYWNDLSVEETAATLAARLAP